MPALSEQMDITLRFCAVYFLMFILLMFNMVFFHTPLSTSIDVPLIIMVIYYWAIYRPMLIPPILVFIIGLCLDLVSGFPVGISAFIFLIVRQIISDQRLFLTGQPFMVIWLGFILLSVAVAIVQWCLFGLIYLQWTPVKPVFLTAVAGALLFPVIAVILNLSHRVLPDLHDQYSAVK